MLNPAEIERDDDGDGWTNLEKQRLGLNPASRDTDADGLHDAQDSCPAFPLSADSSREDAAEISRRAVFAVFAVPRSRFALQVEPGVQTVHIEGMAAPILYEIDRKAWSDRYHGGVFVKWQVLRQRDEDAVVDISDFGGPLAAGGQQIFLRKIDGR
jgi:hypothetical protein